MFWLVVIIMLDHSSAHDGESFNALLVVLVSRVGIAGVLHESRQIIEAKELMGGYDAGTFPENLLQLLGNRYVGRASRLNLYQIECIVLRAGSYRKPCPAQFGDVFGQGFGAVAQGNQLHTMDVLPAELLGELVDVLFVFTDGFGAVSQDGITGDAAHLQNQTVSLGKVDKSLLHVGGFAGFD